MIDKLTPEQEAQLEIYRDKWIKIGLSTEEVPDERKQEIIDKVYDNLLEAERVPLMTASSPKEGWDMVHQLEENVSIEDVNRMKEEGGLPKSSKPFVWPYLDGSFSAAYFSFYDFMFTVLKVDNPVRKEYEAWKDTTEVGLIYPLDGACIVCDKPREIHMNESSQLHKDGGAAIKYGDGWSIYCLNGVRVPEEIAVSKWNEIDPAGFAKISNAEVRREFVRKVGIERIMENCGSEVIDRKDPYELVLIDLKGETGKWPYLKMKNPSIGVYHLECVDKSCQTVDQAIEWRNGSSLQPDVLT